MMNNVSFFTLFICVIACSTRSETSPRPAVDFGSGGENVYQESAEAKCIDGEKRSCHVVLSQHGGVSSCFVGVQFCVNEEWTTCDEN